MEFSCHCQGFRASLIAPPTALINCHCGLCRQLSGAAFSTWATAREQGYTILESAGLRHYQATDNVSRVFCELCGTHVFSVDRRLPGKIGIPAGIITGGILPAPSGQYFVDDKAQWHAITDSTPRYGGANGMEPRTGE